MTSLPSSSPCVAIARSSAPGSMPTAPQLSQPRHLAASAPAAALGGAIVADRRAAPPALLPRPVLQGENNSFSGTTTLSGVPGDTPALEVTGSGLIDRLRSARFRWDGGVGPLLASPPTRTRRPMSSRTHRGLSRRLPAQRSGPSYLHRPCDRTVGPPGHDAERHRRLQRSDGRRPRVPTRSTGLQVTAGGTAIDVQVGVRTRT